MRNRCVACLVYFTCDYLCFGLFGRTCVRRTVVRLAVVLFNRGFFIYTRRIPLSHILDETNMTI